MVVATPIGNLGDMTYRAVETLKNADFICAEDTRVTAKLLNHFEIKKPLVSYHEHNARQAVQLLEAAKVKGGSAQPNRKKVASVTWDQVRAIAEDKMADLNCFTIESAMKLIAGTARSMGITVKGDFPGK